MARNRAFEDENAEASNGNEINTISKKIYPHHVNEGGLSKIVSDFMKLCGSQWNSQLI